MAEIKYPVRVEDDEPVAQWLSEQHIVDADNRTIAIVREPVDAAVTVRAMNAAAGIETMKSGDCVQLKSGGGLMTVREVRDDSDVIMCDWFDVNGSLQEGAFKVAELRRWGAKT